MDRNLRGKESREPATPSRPWSRVLPSVLGVVSAELTPGGVGCLLGAKPLGQSH